MPKPKQGDYLVLQNGTAVIQSVTPNSIDYIDSYEHRRDPESMPVGMLTPVGARGWRIKDRLVYFSVGPARYLESFDKLSAKTIADAGSKYKRTLGLALLKIPKNTVLSSLGWAEVNQAAAKELTKLSLTSDATKWLSITILGYA